MRGLASGGMLLSAGVNRSTTLRTRYLFIGALIGALVSSGACAAMYKWVDEAGVTHYGEKPPPGAKARELGIRNAPSGGSGSGGGSTAARTAQDQEREFQQRRVERLEREKRDEEERSKTAAVAKSKCLSARYRLEVLTSGRPIYRVDEKGKRVYMEDTVRDAQIERTKKDVAASC